MKAKVYYTKILTPDNTNTDNNINNAYKHIL